MTTERQTGTVKWFSNKKGYGFIAPSDSPEDDVFVHQSVVVSGGYRSLFEGWIVEFDMAMDESGKKKAENVTGVGGGPCTGPRPARKPRNADAAAPEKKEANETTTSAVEQPKKKKEAPKKKPAPKKKQARWHEDLSESVTAALDAKAVSRSNGTIDLRVDNTRVKLGNRSYAAIACADGYVAEGTFEVDKADGVVAFVWERALEWNASEWKVFPVDTIMKSLDLKSDSVQAVDDDETPEQLWGPGKGDPKAALETNGFMMRRVVLSNKQVSRVGRNGGAKKGGEAVASE